MDYTLLLQRSEHTVALYGAQINTSSFPLDTRLSLPGDSSSTNCSNEVFLMGLVDPSLWSTEPCSDPTACPWCKEVTAAICSGSAVPPGDCTPALLPHRALRPATHLLTTSLTAKQGCHPSQHGAHLSFYCFIPTNHRKRLSMFKCWYMPSQIFRFSALTQAQVSH